jgi:hypothetical protein
MIRSTNLRVLDAVSALAVHCLTLLATLERITMRPTLIAIGAGLAFAAPSGAAVTALFETPGITLGDDAVECTDAGSYRHCASDAGTERVLSHDGLAAADRIPLDFQLYLPAAPASGADGLYPLVVFIHGWGGSKTSIGGGVESEYVPYAQGGYAVLAYSARAWGDSCGSAQQANPECAGQWNHLADIRYEVRDTQYFAGLLADELSDEGTPLVDPAKVGVTGVSYGGGQSTMLTSLRNRVVDPDGTVHPWTSPAGKPMQIAAAAPYWAWTDLAYALLPNGRTLDYAVNNAYRGPLGGAPYGVSKTSFNAGLYALGLAFSVYAPPGSDPDINTWNALINAGEPYLEELAGPIADAVINYRSGHYWLDAAVEPAPTLFNSGWSDDIFPVTEPVRWIQRAKHLHPALTADLVVSDYGHARASETDAAHAKGTVRAWFDHYLRGIGPAPGPAVRARTQSCGEPAVDYEAGSWLGLAQGEVRLQDPTGGTVLSTGGPSAASAQAFDPIAGGDACARAADEAVPGTVVVDLPAPGGAGYTVLGTPTVIADLTVTGAAESSMIAARLVDVDANGDELLVARGVYRPDASGQQVFQLAPMGLHIPSDHHLQLELMGQEAPTRRVSNVPFSIEVANLDVRIPVAEAPDGQQIQPPATRLLPPGYVPEPGFAVLFASGSALVAMLARRRRARAGDL